MSGDLIPSLPGEAARAYASQLGWLVFPVWWAEPNGRCGCGNITCTSVGKHPITPNGHTDATTDPDVIDRWWMTHPAANVGVACAASGLVVVDVDPRNGGEKTWADLEAEHELPRTLVARTGGGGEHIFYSAVNGDRYPGRMGPGVDVKHNGYVVVPPSSHRSGGTYEWATSGVAPAPFPDVLLRRAGTRSERVSGDSGGVVGSSSADELRRALTDGAPVGQRDELVFRWVVQLKTAGVPVEVAREVIAVMLSNTQCDEQTVVKAHEKIQRIYGDDRYEALEGWQAEAALSLSRPSDPGTALVSGDDIAPDMEPKIRERMISLKVEQLARERLAQENVPDRVRRTAREYVTREPVEPVLDGVIGVGVNLLGGPTEAGKSLLARDWALHVAAGTPWRGRDVTHKRNVLYVAGEGMHDFSERWSSQPLWEAAADHVLVIDEPVNLLSATDVSSLIDEYNDDAPGLVIFDLIYDMGMTDDNGVKDVAPVLAALNRIAAGWWAAVVAVGHPGHNGDRRFRGSSMWRQRALTEFCMAEGTLSCEKSKLTDKRRLNVTGGYRVEYPSLRWLTSGETVVDQATRIATIEDDIRRTPDDSDSERARRLGPVLGVSAERARRLIRDVKRDVAE